VHNVEMVTTLRRLSDVPGPHVPERDPESVASEFVVEWQLRPVHGPEYSDPAGDQSSVPLS
jgi:hypothetical protein